MDIIFDYLAAIIFFIYIPWIFLGPAFRWAYHQPTDRPPLWIYTAAEAEVPADRFAPEPKEEETAPEAEVKDDASDYTLAEDIGFFVNITDGESVSTLRVGMLLDKEGNETPDRRKAAYLMATDDKGAWYDINIKEGTWEEGTTH